MKKIFYVIIILFLVHSAKDLKAQGFTYTNLGPVFVQYPFIQDSVQVVQRRGIVRNTSASALRFRFARIVNNIPASWETQMCYDLCYAGFIDTISLPSDKPYSIAPGHQDTLFYIDFTCVGQGLGTSIVRMYNVENPSLYVQDTFKVQIGSTGISHISLIVDSYNLSQNYPNPFNPTTNINFSIPNSQTVSLKVYDILGNEITALVNNERLTAGTYKVDFNGSSMSSGIYYYTLKTESFIDTKKMILIK